jgi:hypothetical protein
VMETEQESVAQLALDLGLVSVASKALGWGAPWWEMVTETVWVAPSASGSGLEWVAP